MTLLKSTITVILMTMVMTGACSRKDDVDKIRELIQQGVERAQAHQTGNLLKLATDDFIALPGRYNQGRVKGVLFAAFRHYGQFQINYPRPVVQVAPEGHQAQATVYFLIVSHTRELPGLKTLYNDPRQWLEKAAEKADLYQLDLTWSRQDNGWKVRQATLEGFKGTGF